VPENDHRGSLSGELAAQGIHSPLDAHDDLGLVLRVLVEERPKQLDIGEQVVGGAVELARVDVIRARVYGGPGCEPLRDRTAEKYGLLDCVEGFFARDSLAPGEVHQSQANPSNCDVVDPRRHDPYLTVYAVSGMMRVACFTPSI